MILNPVVEADLQYVHARLTAEERAKLRGAHVLLTGCAGFLGYHLMHYFCRFGQDLGLRAVTGLDNFMIRRPHWLADLPALFPDVRVETFDVIHDDLERIPGAASADYVLHMASIASPVFYRKYPIETIEANVWGLKRLLDLYTRTGLKGLLFMSSSEVYGDPDPAHVPTDEEYRGNVATMGPRACYDEAKRFGETVCYLYARQHRMPVTIVRPFNNYGPGMSLDDQRVPADFAKAVLEGRPIRILSDGTPTRTFCYVADAVAGYLKALLHGRFDYFNIGIEQPEISMRELAEIYVRAGRKVCGYAGQVEMAAPAEKEYLTDNPNRRCPVIAKARRLLGYEPAILVEQGVERFLEFLRLSGGRL